MSRPTESEILELAGQYTGDRSLRSELAQEIKEVIDRALEGMIPANEATKLDWPHDATYAKINYYTDTSIFITESRIIYRPKQPWKPTVGADVFVLMSNMTVIKAKVNRIGDVYEDICFLNNGIEFIVERENVKPYSIQDEGKAWDEIGGQR